MRRTGLLLMLAFSLALASCGRTDSGYVRKAVRIMDRDALFATGDTWEVAKKKALKSHPQNREDAYAVVREALAVAGGKHSFLYEPSCVQEDRSSDWAMPTVSVTDDNIMLVTLPQFMGNESQLQKYASTVLDAIPDTVRGVVIDLRGNKGGNMYPMIAAVHPFMADGDHIIRFRGRKRTSWVPLDYVVHNAGVKSLKPISCPVALLTDSLTGSSAEALLICFRGLPRTRVFGAPTAGFASCNTTVSMPDGSYLVLTTGSDVARTGEEFCDDPIPPDVTTNHPQEDALEWLRSL